MKQLVGRAVLGTVLLLAASHSAKADCTINDLAGSWTLFLSPGPNYLTSSLHALAPMSCTLDVSVLSSGTTSTTATCPVTPNGQSTGLANVQVLPEVNCGILINIGSAQSYEVTEVSNQITDTNIRLYLTLNQNLNLAFGGAGPQLSAPITSTLGFLYTASLTRL